MSNDPWMPYLGWVPESSCCLHEQGRKEGRREHLSMSLPSLELSSVARLVRADFHAAKQEEQTSSKSAWLVTCFRILTVKWLNSSVFNSDRSKWEGELDWKDERGHGLGMHVCWVFSPSLLSRVAFLWLLRGRPSRDLALNVNMQVCCHYCCGRG